MKPLKKTYLLYARVSPKGSQWACEETSIAVQLSDMRARVLSTCPNAQFIEVFDEFKSGKDLNRPGIQRILGDLSKSPCPWQCLVVWNLDRLSRSLNDAIPIFSKLRDANCEFISINQEYLSYTGAMARYMLHQTIALAELERGMTAERVSAKLRYLAETGKYPSGRAPLGYRKTDKYTVVVDEEKAPIIRYIFKEFNEGRLGFENVSKLYPGVFKNRQQLYRLLRNKLYIGVLVWNGVEYPGFCPPIIDKKTFDNVQTLLEKSRRNYSKINGKKYDYLLSGLLVCHCGRHMTPYSVKKGDKRFFYYKCTNPQCKNAVNAEDMDAAVVDELVRNYTQESKIRESIKVYLEETEAANAAKSSKRAKVEKELAAAREKEKRVADMFWNGIVNQSNKDYWNDELTSARAVRVDLENQFNELQQPSADVDIDKALPALIEAAAEWAKKIAAGEVDYSIRRNLIMSAVQSCICLARENNSITFELTLVMNCGNVWRAERDLIITCIFTLFCGYRSRVSSRQHVV